MSDPMRCQQCGDVIGVYEPLVMLADGHPRETSRALELGNPEHRTDGVCYHSSCYERLGSAKQLEE